MYSIGSSSDDKLDLKIICHKLCFDPILLNRVQQIYYAFSMKESLPNHFH